jgi:hypothetical protein
MEWKCQSNPSDQKKQRKKKKKKKERPALELGVKGRKLFKRNNISTEAQPHETSGRQSDSTFTPFGLEMGIIGVDSTESRVF